MLYMTVSISSWPVKKTKKSWLKKIIKCVILINMVQQLQFQVAITWNITSETDYRKIQTLKYLILNLHECNFVCHFKNRHVIRCLVHKNAKWLNDKLKGERRSQYGNKCLIPNRPSPTYFAGALPCSWNIVHTAANW